VQQSSARPEGLIIEGFIFDATRGGAESVGVRCVELCEAGVALNFISASTPELGDQERLTLPNLITETKIWVPGEQNRQSGTGSCSGVSSKHSGNSRLPF
jgi:hypothetical protein